ncbi:SAVMC3_10250 family protein [Amycolatopsis anabasis]|uniref:SAVMC3_10250 family protein n=1 Tax=Amycolatopsis anabasis TaxID=1840409 RepID=UPI00131C84D5|nr:SAVMC3_10250 family protein [Amycolatopsis anabasis]
MRELVYLSDRKLRQFLGDRRRRWWQRTGVEGELKIPFLGQLKLTRAAEDAERPELDEVIAQIEESTRAARWYADETVRPGQWVQFEAPLNYSAMGRKYFHSAVLFLDSGQQDVRLLLHGSPEHLLIGRDRRVAVDSELDKFAEGLNSPSYEYFWYYVAGGRYGLTFHTDPRDAIRAVWAEGPQGFSKGDIQSALRLTVDLLDERFSPVTAAWMAGYARVTASTTLLRQPGTDPARLVVATPLYVEYVHPPEADELSGA